VTFKFTAKQLEAQPLCAGPATHTMLYGGSRSGKTLLHVRNTVMRALKAPGSRHLIARFRFGHVKTSICYDTFPRVMAACFPEVPAAISKSDWFWRAPNASEIWFAGLDDKQRTEKVLGNEYATLLLNECSQISWTTREMLMTRLAQRVEQKIQGMPPSILKLRAFYDCNPTSKAHWTHRLFKQKVDPETKTPLGSPDSVVAFQMNPRDNVENLSPEYMQMLAGLSARMRRRFEFGEFAEATPNALFDEADIDKWRVMDSDDLPQMVRIVVAVDPSGSGDADNADNDEIGIAAAGLGVDGIGYVLEDCSVKAGPATWGKVAGDTYDRHKANVVVGEGNFGGDMVRHVIQTARPRTPFKMVTASRGKALRAEPFSALYETGKVRHVGILQQAEDELCALTTTGYTGTGSPNRADAVIWALAELFPGLVAGPKVEKPKRERSYAGGSGWMA
jgi:Phage terminase large subunit/Terminase RNaseH-like domain